MTYDEQLMQRALGWLDGVPCPELKAELRARLTKGAVRPSTQEPKEPVRIRREQWLFMEEEVWENTGENHER